MDIIYHINTPKKNNMEHKHGGLDDVFPFQTGDIQVPAVSFSEA